MQKRPYEKNAKISQFCTFTTKQSGMGTVDNSEQRLRGSLPLEWGAPWETPYQPASIFKVYGGKGFFGGLYSLLKASTKPDNGGRQEYLQHKDYTLPRLSLWPQQKHQKTNSPNKPRAGLSSHHSFPASLWAVKEIAIKHCTIAPVSADSVLAGSWPWVRLLTFDWDLLPSATAELNSQPRVLTHTACL